MARHFSLTADGGSRGNPGPAGYGSVITENGKIIAELYDFIGIATNNVAEYCGLIAGLTAINAMDPEATVDVKMDSKLVVEQIVTRITRDEARLNGGSASPKELEQLQHEVGTLGARRAELEEVELEIMMRVDEINSRITSLKAEEAEHAAVIADLEIRKENAMASINNDLDAIAKDRSETLQSIEKALVDLYEKIRETTGGAGAAALVAGACTGCNLSINTVELKRITELAEDEVVRCEECRCILVRGV
jgi:predicted  nucleic acid-binding Zn-ribbon protein